MNDLLAYLSSANFREAAIAWSSDHGVKIFLILVGIFLARKFSGVFIEKAIRRF
jgi:hypothetical protein